MKEKMTPHIIAVTAFVAFVVLGLASATMTPEQLAEFEAQQKAAQEALNEASRQYWATHDEYAVGAINGDAVYWKNMIASTLPRAGVGAQGNIATAIVASGDDVYIAGEVLYSATSFEAVYWKNERAVTLPRGSASVSEATSIVVSGNDVYVTGRADNDAVYWKNGQLVTLPRGNARKAVVNSIALSGNDAYAAGYLDMGGTTQAVYWRSNGQPVTLSNNAVAAAIAISGNNVYVVGYTDSKAILWTNGQAAVLPGDTTVPAGRGTRTLPSGGFSRANSIFISGADVYIGGSANHVDADETIMRATYWKNGKRYILNEGGDDGAYANSIFVVDDIVYVGGYASVKIIDSNIPFVWVEKGRQSIAYFWKYYSQNATRWTIFQGHDWKKGGNSVIRDIYVVKK